MSDRARAMRVAVIGGGISGLAAAHHLIELDPSLDVSLLEASDRLGGVLETVRQDGFLIERAADNFITSVPWAVDLCGRIGLADQLLPTNSRFRAAEVVCRGRLLPVPRGFVLMAPTKMWPILTSPILSLPGKLRLVAELLIPARKSGGDESLASFVRRRLGRETFERLVQPLVGGIYAADPEKLSLAATLPRFLEMEREHGSLIASALQQPTGRKEASGESGARYGLFATPREGMSSMVDAVAARLPAGAVQLRARVERVERDSDGSWQITFQRDSGAAIESRGADALIVATPAPHAAALLRALDRQLADDLARIEYSGTVVVVLAFRQDQLATPIRSFGFVVPAIEGRRILAASFPSVKFPGRAPPDQVLLRVFVGGACQSELAALDDDSLRNLVFDELAQLLGVRGEPTLCHIARWPGTMPQYHVGHCELVERIERRTALVGRLALAGSAYHGVGIPHCVHSGEQAAESVAKMLSKNPPI